jgi:type I restriction-modification system DNA methylase subunit
MTHKLDIVESAAKEIKENGVHYTPKSLSDFVARAIWRNIENKKVSQVFDPAVGEGILLDSIQKYAPSNLNIEYFGSDIDSNAITNCLTNNSFGSKYHFGVKDFVDEINNSRGLFGNHPERLNDIIVMNPPYVRTQNLTSEKIKKTAIQLGLRGRTDLAHVFIAGAGVFLNDGGVLAVITSNKFMQTQAGEGLRSIITREFEICELWDFGDTKIFGAAVLPMVMILKKKALQGGTIKILCVL